MFRQRTNSQKPGEDLLANFRQQFPQVSTAGSSTLPATQTTGAPGNALLVGAQIDGRPSLNQDAFRDQDPTPRASAEPWRFTPSLPDPNSFSAFANQPPGYYTPTPGGTNTIYYPEARDLHTPTLSLGMGLGTPLSMPTSEGARRSDAPMMDLSQFHQHQGMPPYHFQQFNPFIQAAPQQASYAPSSFAHEDTCYETMDQDGSPLDSAFHSQSPPVMGFQPTHFGMALGHGMPSSAEKFRFRSTLNAPTAMIKQADEIPVTYLNKGQAYSLSVLDTSAALPVAPGTRYRTFVRVSFEDDQQRQKPVVCWSLWKEGRGTNEAHQRGGKLQAIEYVEAGQPAEGDDKRTRIELDTASFDGFSVNWSPGVDGEAECNMAVRFNFLSTDFSHSKGVKGLPVRLCAKTVLWLADANPPPPEEAGAEICYCKVKLFRDHGAERKLANDVAHVKKTIDKLKQQIAQAESGMKNFGKEKRGSTSHAKSQDVQRPGKFQKHKRTWFMSSASSAGGAAGGGGGRPSLEDDLHFRLQTLQDMFTSTRPVSILYLKGEELDDPDLHPVTLAGEPTDLTKVESKDSAAWRIGKSSVAGSSLVSPSPSNMSLQSQVSAAPKAQWTDFSATRGESSATPLDQATKVKEVDESGNLSGGIEALGVDQSYRPPVERSPKPVACFYIARRPATGEKKELHRAVYLHKRGLAEFTALVAAKWGIDSNKIVRTIRALASGLNVEMDDDVIEALSEGQDMLLDVVEVETTVPQPKREWEMAVDKAEEETSSAHSVLRPTTGYELRLTF